MKGTQRALSETETQGGTRPATRGYQWSKAQKEDRAHHRHRKKPVEKHNGRHWGAEFTNKRTKTETAGGDAEDGNCERSSNDSGSLCGFLADFQITLPSGLLLLIPIPDLFMRSKDHWVHFLQLFHCLARGFSCGNLISFSFLSTREVCSYTRSALLFGPFIWKFALFLPHFPSLLPFSFSRPLLALLSFKGDSFLKLPLSFMLSF